MKFLTISTSGARRRQQGGKEAAGSDGVEIKGTADPPSSSFCSCIYVVINVRVGACNLCTCVFIEFNRRVNICGSYLEQNWVVVLGLLVSFCAL